MKTPHRECAFDPHFPDVADVLRRETGMEAYAQEEDAGRGEISRSIADAMGPAATDWVLKDLPTGGSPGEIPGSR